MRKPGPQHLVYDASYAFFPKWIIEPYNLSMPCRYAGQIGYQIFLPFNLLGGFSEPVMEFIQVKLSSALRNRDMADPRL